MALKLMYITNNPIVAKAAEEAGIDWIFIDLEVNGKELRQPNMDTVKSNHAINYILVVKKILKKSKVLVRVNPIYEGSQEEIDKCIEFGADILMLPFFKTIEEINVFLNIVSNRVKTCLLLETSEAVDLLTTIVTDKRINYIHIGLNDLHLEMKLTFMFELLADGTVKKIIDVIRPTNIVYGFGGIAGLGDGDLPAELVIKEHYRLGSSMAILSRAFYKQTGLERDVEPVKKIFVSKIQEIREYENKVENLEQDDYNLNFQEIQKRVKRIVERKKDELKLQNHN